MPKMVQTEAVSDYQLELNPKLSIKETFHSKNQCENLQSL